MNYISKTSVTVFSLEEMRELVKIDSSLDLSKCVCLRVYYDGEFEDASGNPDYQHEFVYWFSTSFAAHRQLLSILINEVL